MKILYDFQAFSMQRFGGVSRYFSKLMNQFGDDPDLTWELPVRYSDNEYLPDLRKQHGCSEGVAGPCPDFPKWLNFRGKQRLCQWQNRLRAAGRIQAGEYDIFHPTYYDDYFLEFLPPNKPFVLTVYDMIQEIYPEHFLLSDPLSSCKKALVQKAARIIAISETTKKDLVNIFGVAQEKITVIYLANSLSADEKSMDSNAIKDLPAPYLLFVGDRGRYKNFYFFIRSVSELLRKNPKLRVICAGSGFTVEESQFFKNLGLTDKIKQYAVDDVQLAHLYRNARAFVLPSLYEGFGLPVLESFNCGCPAILSMTGSLPEIGGDAAIYFDPKNSGSIRDVVSRVINDENIRRELIRKGKIRVNDFSWEKTARMTRQVYTEVRASSNPKITTGNDCRAEQ